MIYILYQLKIFIIDKEFNQSCRWVLYSTQSMVAHKFLPYQYSRPITTNDLFKAYYKYGFSFTDDDDTGVDFNEAANQDGIQYQEDLNLDLDDNPDHQANCPGPDDSDQNDDPDPDDYSDQNDDPDPDEY